MESRVYDELYRLEKDYWWHLSKRKFVIEEIKQRDYFSRNSKVLDAGCGTGIVLLELRGLGLRVYGLDKSKMAQKFCYKRGLHVRLGNLEKKLPYRANFFDAITCLDVIEHLDDDKKALRELHRVLRKNGRLFITVPAFQFLWTKHDDILWHKRRYRRSQLVKLVKREGFVVEKSTYFYSFLFPPAVILFKLKLMFSKTKDDTSVIPPKIINQALLLLSAMERKVANYFPLPFGLSVFLVARKK